MSMVAMACQVKLEVSMRIGLPGDHAEVGISAEVSVVAAMPCAGDGTASTVGIACMGPRTKNDPYFI